MRILIGMSALALAIGGVIISAVFVSCPHIPGIEPSNPKNKNGNKKG